MMKDHGFTMVELLVVVLIFTVISIAIFGVLLTGRQSWYAGNTQIELQEESRKAMRIMVKDLRESKGSTVSDIYQFTDPINGEKHQAISFASARGNPSDSADDGVHANNDYFHLDSSSSEPSWRSLVVYCTYQTSSGQNQLRKYVDYNATNYSATNTFPFAFVSVTTGQISLQSSNDSPVTVNINRNPAAAVILANYVETEDTNLNAILNTNENDGNASLPADNSDGELDFGINFTKSGDQIDIKLFLRKETTAVSARSLIITLDNTVILRN